MDRVRVIMTGQSMGRHGDSSTPSIHYDTHDMDLLLMPLEFGGEGNLT